MKIMIVAVDDTMGIGRDGKLPWHLPEDLQRFKRLTSGHICIMGYNSYEEIAHKMKYPTSGKLLPNRENYVVTSRIIPTSDHVKSFSSLEDAIEAATLLHPNKDIYFIGGVGIYNTAMKYTDKLYLTQVKGAFECDRHLEAYQILSHFDWDGRTIESETDKYIFQTLTRKENDLI